MLVRTISTAANTATFGWPMPSARAKPIAFWQMSRFWSVSGAMFRATSLMTKRRAYVGTDIITQWLIRRPARNFASFCMIACKRTSVCKLPFISAPTSPAPAAAAAFRAESSAPSVPTIRYLTMSR